MLERLNEEIRWRTHVLRIFPIGESCLRLVRALAVETQRELARAASLVQHGRSARAQEGGRCAVPPEPPPVQPSTVLALAIGIGGHLAMPPLPHHRAYGSVPRRFGGLSTRQLFHGKQTQTTEANFGEGAMQRFREAQPPRSLWAEDSRTG